MRSVCSPIPFLAMEGFTSVVGMFLGFPYFVAHFDAGDQVFIGSYRTGEEP